MNPIPHRIVVYPKDVMNITGLSRRSAQRLLERVRKASGKGEGSFVSIEEFCQFTGLKEEAVGRFLV
jgi:predicted DNA-binding transcriptional regulator AlpA